MACSGKVRSKRPEHKPFFVGLKIHIPLLGFWLHSRRDHADCWLFVVGSVDRGCRIGNRGVAVRLLVRTGVHG